MSDINRNVSNILRRLADELSPKRLLLHDWFGTSPVCTPTFLKANLGYLDTLPFDGVAIYLRKPDLTENLTTLLTSPQPVSYDRIASVLGPVKDLAPAQLRHNFAAVITKAPPDFFDDWSAVVQNFANLARAAKDFNLEGIYFDNETYFSPWSNYPDGVKDKTKTLKQYQDQVALRGRQIMEAMEAQFPEIVILSLHGPYVSRPDAPAPLFPQWQSSNELMGPLFEGMLSGRRTGTVVDGGELYQLRTQEEFRQSYDWRKAHWPAESVGFGVYDKPFGGKPMTPAVLQRTLVSALNQSDRYVWLYVEGPTFLLPAAGGGASDDLVQAVRDATRKPY